MMKKIVILLALSQVALAGALYASDNVWSGTGANEAHEPVAAVKSARVAVATPAVADADSCGTHAWPNIPARCLNAGGEGLPRSAQAVRTIALN